MSSEVSVSIENVSKKFEIFEKPSDRLKELLIPGRSYHKDFWALRNVSLKVNKGETFALIGRNGSGKSTLLQLVVGTLQPTTGEVKVKGLLAALLELGSGFNPNLTGRENIFINGLLLGLSHSQIESKFDDIAAFADIGFHLNQPVKTYSSGMYVRLAFAVQACIHPEILIVDEALAVGDEKFQRKCYAYIEKLRDQGSTILLVTHSTSTVEKFCQRAAFLENGRLITVGKAKDVIDVYHTSLYADLKAYVRELNKCCEQNDVPVSGKNISDDDALPVSADAHSVGNNCSINNTTYKNRAKISNIEITTIEDEVSEVFRVGEKAKIKFKILVNDDINELQIGLLFRTLEGVSAAGTSSQYFDKNISFLKRGEIVSVTVETELSLSCGSYFLTVAIAENLMDGSQVYVDRVADSVLLKIIDPFPTCTGIALLHFSIDVERSNQ